MSDIRKAQCACGACVVQVAGDPLINAVCHCNNCKQRTGSAFGLSAYFRLSQFSVVSGEARHYELTNEYGDQRRCFCPDCGTTLYWFTEYLEGMVGVAAGCFAENPLPPPTISANDETRCAWVEFSVELITDYSEDDIPRA